MLALEPYYGGSHRAFLDQWVARSEHQWTVLGLPARKWKWRMRHAAVTLAEQVGQRIAAGEAWDLVFCSSMLNLAEWRGLSPDGAGRLPAVLYFHENQLTYPVQIEDKRDHHFAFTHFTSMLAASEIWFNSGYHRRSFLKALETLLRRMPDFRSIDRLRALGAGSRVEWPGIEEPEARPRRRPKGPARILWVARWEYDKGPETFFEALFELKKRVDFRLLIHGQQFERQPEIFERARVALADRIEAWGYCENRASYLESLAEADIVVSTARHEFFGLGVLEAIASGCCPLLPDRLSYPELLEEDGGGRSRSGQAEHCFYDGSVAGLIGGLEALCREVARQDVVVNDAQQRIERFYWCRRAPRLDAALRRAATSVG